MINDLLLILKSDLGTGNERRKKNGVSFPALPAPDALDSEDEHNAVVLYAAVIEAVKN